MRRYALLGERLGHSYSVPIHQAIFRVLGLEAAWELKKSGLAVTVLEAAPVLMGRQLDGEAGALLKDIAARQGIAIYTGANVSRIRWRRCAWRTEPAYRPSL